MVIWCDKILSDMDGPYIFSLLPHILVSKLFPVKTATKASLIEKAT